MFLWYQGGRNIFGHHPMVREMTKSIFAVLGVSLGEVKVVKMLGSAWWNSSGPIGKKRRRSFVGSVVAMPGDNVRRRRVVQVCLPPRTTPLHDHA
jgi:hypothetical protein